MNFKPLDAAFGLGLEIDLSEEATADEQRMLRELLSQHHLFLIRAPGLTHADQVRFASYFGPSLAIGSDDAVEQYVSNTRPDGVLGTSALRWHSDISYAPVPYTALGLYALEVESGRSSTRFASATRGYAALPPALRESLAFRQVVNITELPDDAAAGVRGQRLVRNGPSAACAAHPVLMPHPRSGLPLLYVNEMHSDCILGMPSDQSRQVLLELFSRLYSAENVYEHFWEVGDYVLWDNLTVQHARGDVSGVGVRTLRKVTIGSRQLRYQFPQIFETIPYRNTAGQVASPNTAGA